MSSASPADAGGVKLRAIQGDARKLADQGPPPLRRACGHVAGDPVIVRRGYRYLPRLRARSRRLLHAPLHARGRTRRVGDARRGHRHRERRGHARSLHLHRARRARAHDAARRASGRSCSRSRTRPSPGASSAGSLMVERPRGVRRVRGRADRAAAARPRRLPAVRRARAPRGVAAPRATSRARARRRARPRRPGSRAARAPGTGTSTRHRAAPRTCGRPAIR